MVFLEDSLPYLLLRNNSNVHMRIIALKTLRLFWEQHPDAQQALQAWYRDAKRATWKTPADIKNVYRNASIVGNNRVVFNIRGNQYRLVVAVNYTPGILYRLRSPRRPLLATQNNGRSPQTPMSSVT